MTKINHLRIYKLSSSAAIIFILCNLSRLASAVPIEAVFNELDPSASVGTHSLSQISNGVSMTMRGYQVEIDSSGNETVYGPAPTEISGRKVFNYDGSAIIFTALPGPGFAITETDLPGGGLIIPGFDTVSFSSFSTIEWMEIVFSSAVDISFIDVDDTSNFDRNIWAVGSDLAFDYSGGLSGAISGRTVLNSQDDATDGPFRHSFSPILNVTTLLIGSAPEFDLGDIEGQIRGSQFFITGLGFELSSVDGGSNNNGNPIPEPTTLALLGIGLAGLSLSRRKEV